MILLVQRGRWLVPPRLHQNLQNQWFALRFPALLHAAATQGRHGAPARTDASALSIILLGIAFPRTCSSGAGDARTVRRSKSGGPGSCARRASPSRASGAGRRGSWFMADGVGGLLRDKTRPSRKTPIAWAFAPKTYVRPLPSFSRFEISERISSPPVAGHAVVKRSRQQRGGGVGRSAAEQSNKS